MRSFVARGRVRFALVRSRVVAATFQTMMQLHRHGFRFATCVALLALGGCTESSDGLSRPGLSDGGAPLQNPTDHAGEHPPIMCDVTAPSSCPEPTVKYATIKPIVAERCVPCHDGRGPQWPFADYGDLADWQDAIRGMLLACEMPPPDSGITMTTAEREQMLGWIRCGLPR